MNRKKICITGTQGVGKTQICEKILTKIWCSKEYYSNLDIDEYKHFGGNANIINYTELIQDIANIAFIPEQFREVMQLLGNPKEFKQTEEITLATYAKQLYLENLYTAQGKNILCDRSILDTFVYYDYFCNIQYQKITCFLEYHIKALQLNRFLTTYSKIYLIEPSDREIENDGFRLTDKKQQLEVHKLFLEYFKDFSNVEIINQEDAFKEEFIEKVAREYEKIL